MGDSESQTGIPLGPFVLDDVIGRAGMGVVWRGSHVEQRVPVAVKVLTMEGSRDPLYLASLRNEVRGVAGLDHPAVVRLYDQGELPAQVSEATGGDLAPGSPFVVMELAEGGTLWPDLPSAGPAAEGSAAAIHRSEAIYDQLMHSLDVVPGSEVATLWDGAPARVNSVHHQGLREVGIGLRVTARAPDGLPEAVERPGGPWVLGVQWHPEWMTGDLQQERLFERFVRRAGEGR